MYYDFLGREIEDPEMDAMREDAEAERPMPDMGHVYPPAPCVVCGKPASRACMRCGEPVCIHPSNYMAKSSCGNWIMDWWSNGAMDPDDGNEFWCAGCLKEEYGPDAWVPPTEEELAESSVATQSASRVSDGVQGDDYDPFLDPDETLP